MAHVTPQTSKDQALRYEHEPVHILRVPNAHRLSIDKHHSVCWVSPLFSPSSFSVQLTTGVSLYHRNTGMAPMRPEAVVRFLLSSSHSPFARTSPDTFRQGRPFDFDLMHAFIRCLFFSPPPSLAHPHTLRGLYQIICRTVIAHVHALYNMQLP